MFLPELARWLLRLSSTAVRVKTCGKSGRRGFITSPNIRSSGPQKGGRSPAFFLVERQVPGIRLRSAAASQHPIIRSNSLIQHNLQHPEHGNSVPSFQPPTAAPERRNRSWATRPTRICKNGSTGAALGCMVEWGNARTGPVQAGASLLMRGISCIFFEFVASTRRDGRQSQSLSSSSRFCSLFAPWKLHLDICRVLVARCRKTTIADFHCSHRPAEVCQSIS